MTLTLHRDAGADGDAPALLPGAGLLQALRVLQTATGAAGVALAARTDDGPVHLAVGTAHPEDEPVRVAVPPGARHGGGVVRLSSPDRTATAEGRAALADLLALLLDSELGRRDAERAEDRAAREARQDPLTGLGNRRAWQQALQRGAATAQRDGCALAVLVVDLDALKQVNDGAGHEAGDALLRLTAAVLQAGGRAHDTVCRLGGDEFGLVAVLHDGEDAGALRDRVHVALGAAGVAASVGVAVAPAPLGPDDLARLADAADLSMYRAKRARRALQGQPAPPPDDRT